MDVNSKNAIRLGAFLPYQLVLLADLVSRRIATVVKRREGLNLSHWRVMAAVAEVPGRTAREVVAVTPMDKGIVSRAVKSLIEKGLVERRASDSDGRLGHLHLTTRGEAAYASIAADILDVEADMVRGLEAGDRAALQRHLAALLESLREAD
ncbi:MarR family winged helix-turn-helix transcriptional regulator [Sphingomicrobium nitratireducens]|uniref:MarR family winged helix-turn-helix transcriptional regulator n=1 Tax=Sphingomicrobium nitratireducens TaxID=2964666 RepID=UPI00223EC26D|nr:MarR family winged helix-turn-helix transcriptional regulator [Sphingomicrobium nitratireducens]